MGVRDSLVFSKNINPYIDIDSEINRNLISANVIYSINIISNYRHLYSPLEKIIGIFFSISVLFDNLFLINRISTIDIN